MLRPDNFDADDYVNGMYEFAQDNNLSPDELEEYFKDGFEDFDEKYEDYIDRAEIEFLLDFDEDDLEEFKTDDDFSDEFKEFYKDYYSDVNESDSDDYDNEFEDFYSEYYEDL